MTLSLTLTLQAIGADHVYDRNELVSVLSELKNVFHVCLDVVGGEHFGLVVDALRPGGKYVTSGLRAELG